MQAFDKLIARLAQLDPRDGEVDKEAAESLRAKFTEAMDNDINTSLAVTALYDVLKADVNDATKLWLAEDFDRVLCLDLIKKAEEKRSADAAQADPELCRKIEALIEERAAAKRDKNYARADEIRNEISALGAVLEDTKDGTKYKIVN